ncbi:MAG: hypothetical protein K2P93_04395 [Alphaproteobacteria bacterium]|nr:hypothetical protein [Alphaproteobacteria bacterium]
MFNLNKLFIVATALAVSLTSFELQAMDEPEGHRPPIAKKKRGVQKHFEPHVIKDLIEECEHLRGRATQEQHLVRAIQLLIPHVENSDDVMTCLGSIYLIEGEDGDHPILDLFEPVHLDLCTPRHFLSLNKWILEQALSPESPHHRRAKEEIDHLMEVEDKARLIEGVGPIFLPHIIREANQRDNHSRRILVEECMHLHAEGKQELPLLPCIATIEKWVEGQVRASQPDVLEELYTRVLLAHFRSNAEQFHEFFHLDQLYSIGAKDILRTYAKTIDPSILDAFQYDNCLNVNGLFIPITKEQAFLTLHKLIFGPENQSDIE